MKSSMKRSSKKTKKRFLLSRKSEWLAEECMTQLFPDLVGLYVYKLNNIVKVEPLDCKHEVKLEPLEEIQYLELNNPTTTNQVFNYKLYSTISFIFFYLYLPVTNFSKFKNSFSHVFCLQKA